MPEKTLNSALSGAEIVEALRDRILDKLRRDCYLNPNHAYDWFEANIQIKVKLHDTGEELETSHQVSFSSGTPKPDSEEVEVEVELEKRSPNEVRVETGQPVPVLTKDKDGRSIIEGIKYGRKALLQT